MTSDKETRILLADDHPMFRAGLRSMLESTDGFSIVGEAADGAEAVALARQTVPDILLLDVAMPLLSGLEVLRDIADLNNTTRSILLTASMTKDQIMYALQLGARGVLWKQSAAHLLLKSIRCVMSEELWVSREIVGDLVHTLRRIPAVQRCEATADLQQLVETTVPCKNTVERKFGLTSREVEIVRAIVDGKSNRDIAATYAISEYTVKHHLTSIFDKVGVYSRLELAVFAIHHGLSDPHQNVPRSA
jgi:two-component system nitrate/nitrite response regulator NarL